jgi:hypothetical protein
MNHKFHLLILQESCPSIDSIFKAPPNSEAPFSIAEVQAAINKFPHVVDALVYINTSGAVDPIPPTRQFTGFGNNGREGSISPATLASKNTEEESFYDRCHKDLQFSISQAISRFKALGFALILGEVSFEVFIQQWLTTLPSQPKNTTYVNNQTYAIDNSPPMCTSFARQIPDDSILMNHKNLSVEDTRWEILKLFADVSFINTPIAWINRDAKKTKEKAFTTATQAKITRKKKPQEGSILDTTLSLATNLFFDTPKLNDKPECPYYQFSSFFIVTALSFDQLAQEWSKKKGLRLELHAPNERVQIWEEQSIGSTLNKVAEVSGLSLEYLLQTSLQNIIAAGYDSSVALQTKDYHIYYFGGLGITAEEKTTLAERKKSISTPTLFIFGESLCFGFFRAKYDVATLLRLKEGHKHITSIQFELTIVEETLETIQKLVALQTISFEIPELTQAQTACTHLAKKLEEWINNLGAYNYDYLAPISSTNGYTISSYNNLNVDLFYAHFSSLDKDFYPYYKNIYSVLNALHTALEKRIATLIAIYTEDQFLSGETYTDCQFKINTLEKLNNPLLIKLKEALIASEKKLAEIAQDTKKNKAPHSLQHLHDCFQEYIDFLRQLNQWPLDLEKMEIANELFILKTNDSSSHQEKGELKQKILALEQYINALKDFEQQLHALDDLEDKKFKSETENFIRLRFEIYRLISLYQKIPGLSEKEKETLTIYLKDLKETGPFWSGAPYSCEMDEINAYFESLKVFTDKLFSFEQMLGNNFSTDLSNETIRAKKKKIIADLSQNLLVQTIKSINALEENQFPQVSSQSLDFFAQTKNCCMPARRRNFNIQFRTDYIIVTPVHLSHISFLALQKTLNQQGLTTDITHGNRNEILLLPHDMQAITMPKQFSISGFKDAYQAAYVELSENELRKTVASTSQPTIAVQPKIAQKKRKLYPLHILQNDPLDNIPKPRTLKKPSPFAWKVFWRALAAPIVEITFPRSPPFWMWMTFLGVTTGFTLQTWAPTNFTLLAPYLMVFLSLSICAATASLLVCAIVKADKAKSAADADAKTEATADSEIVAYFKNRFEWMHEHRILAALSIATGIGAILGITFIPETFFSELVHSVCMIFLGESSPLAIEVISTIMMTATAILLPLLISEGIMRIAMTATEVADIEDKSPTRIVDEGYAYPVKNYDEIFSLPLTYSSKEEEASETPRLSLTGEKK